MRVVQNTNISNDIYCEMMNFFDLYEIDFETVAVFQPISSFNLCSNKEDK